MFFVLADDVNQLRVDLYSIRLIDHNLRLQENICTDFYSLGELYSFNKFYHEVCSEPTDSARETTP